jgi:dihydrofolate reductase
MTRRLTAHLFYSVNGVAESPNLWQFDAFGPEEGQMMGRAISGGTDVVIGRKLWQEWSQYWPDADASDRSASSLTRYASTWSAARSVARSAGTVP